MMCDSALGYITNEEHLKNLESSIISNESITQETKGKLIEVLSDKSKRMTQKVKKEEKSEIKWS